MLSITYTRVPLFLRDGSFYLSLCSDEPDCEIEIPEQCYAVNDTVHDVNDFLHLIKATAFWGLYQIPRSLMVFCDVNGVDVWFALLETECTDLPFAQALRTIFTLRWERGPFLVAAILSGFTEIVKYLAVKYIDGTEAAGKAAELGRLDYLELLHRHGHPWGRFVWEQAVEGGHLDCLQYLHTNGCTWDNSLYLAAAEFGRFECLKYAYEQGLQWHPNIAETLAEYGNVNMLQYAVEHGCLLDETAIIAAAEYGHSECLQYLLSVDCPIDDNACYFAAENGHIECLKLLHQYEQLQPSWDIHTTEVAATWGHLACLQYLHEHGCPWDESTTCTAANHGRVEVLRYSMEHQCPYPAELLRYAIRSSSPNALACLKYLLEECSLSLCVDGAEFVEAFAFGNALMMQSLIDIGCPFLDCKLTEESIDSYFASYVFQPVSLESYDARLVQCIKCAHTNHWDIVKNGTGLCKFVKSHAYRLPLCSAYLASLNDAKG